MKSTVANMIDEDLRDGTITRESVYPGHNTGSDECWCEPVVEVMENGTKVIIHNEEC